MWTLTFDHIGADEDFLAQSTPWDHSNGYLGNGEVPVMKKPWNKLDPYDLGGLSTIELRTWGNWRSTPLVSLKLPTNQEWSPAEHTARTTEIMNQILEGLPEITRH